jgi:mono/diheme cytochrome c family protein
MGTIDKVELSTDGKKWLAASVEPPHADGGWQAFTATIDVKRLGPLTVQSRATDSAGNTQPQSPQWNPSGYARNWVQSVKVQVAPLAPGVADRLLADRCLTCHTIEMISSQRLSPAAWDHEIAKMQGFGAKLSADERRILLQYVSQWSPKLPPEVPVTTSFQKEAALVNTLDEAEGDPGRGMHLYADNCANCHGAQGEGGVGPRLKGRMVTRANFWASVLHGRNIMPAFGEQLQAQQIADIRSYLNQPVNLP